MSKKALAVLAAALLCFTPVRTLVAQDPISIVAGTLTGTQAIAGLRDAANNVVSHAGDVGQETAGRIANDLRGLANDLQRTLKDQVNRPLTDMRVSAEVQIQKALTALRLSESFLSAITTCTREDAAFLLASLEGTIRQSARDVIPWASGAPQVLAISRLDPPAEFGLRVGAPQTIALRGINLSSDEACDRPSGVIRVDGPDSALTVSPQGPRQLVIRTAAIKKPGAYDVEIGLYRKRWFFFCRPTSVRATLAVLPKPQFRVTYRVSTTHSFPIRIHWNAGEWNEGSDKHNDRHPNKSFSLPEGYTYAAHQWEQFSCNGCVKEAEQVNGNGIYMQFRIPAQGCAWFVCGPGKWVHGRMWIDGVRDSTDADGPRLDGEVPTVLAYGQSVTLPIQIAPPPNSRIVNWSVDVRFLYPDGSEHAIPVQTGTKTLTASETLGGSFSWDPTAGTLTVTAPRYGCGR